MADLKNALSQVDVSNVFIYVGDAVRFDYCPDSVLGKGLSVKTISASIHSPTSFASIVTGLHPPQHGVNDFTDQLDEELFDLFDIPGFDTRFLNSVREQPAKGDPIFSVLDIDPPPSDEPFAGIDEPFVIMERGPGGHAPYGDFDGSAWEYFEQRGSQSADAYREEYTESVERDADLFRSRLNELADRGLLDDTLVIYTSDHGELLGELGTLGHNGPMHPALVEVPTVFVHPELPNEQLTGEGVFRHVDLLPWLLAVLDLEEPSPGEGTLPGQSSEFGISFYRSSLPTGSLLGFEGALVYEGVWDEAGGHVFPRTSLPERLLALFGKAIKSPKRDYMRANLVEASRAYTRGARTYGNPELTRADAEETLAGIGKMETSARTVELSDDQQEQLRDLGYLQ